MKHAVQTGWLPVGSLGEDETLQRAVYWELVLGVLLALSAPCFLTTAMTQSLVRSLNPSFVPRIFQTLRIEAAHL